MSEQPQHQNPPPGQEPPPPPPPGGGQPHGGQPGQPGPGQPYGAQPGPGQPYPPPPPQGGYVQPMSPPDQRTWGMVAHLAPFVASLVGLPFLGSLVVYLIYKDRGDFVRRHSAESLNFQLTLLIAYVVAGLLIFVLIGFVLLPLLWIASVILQIVAAVAAYNGQEYRYPMTIRFVS
ncbi:MAG TPA: DUF4870 domain-containing protein [Segeticoccus sp.]|nr:DUF4870 domain-containing protein [Segeticoccus sp.]